MKQVVVLAVLTALVTPGRAAPTTTDVATEANAKREALWPQKAVPKRAIQRRSGPTNAERLKRGLPLAKPHPKRLLGGPAEAQASGTTRVYYRGGCFASLGSAEAFNTGKTDPTEAANVCASANAAQSPNGSFALRMRPEDADGTITCYTNAVLNSFAEACTTDNYVVYDVPS